MYPRVGTGRSIPHPLAKRHATTVTPHARSLRTAARRRPPFSPGPGSGPGPSVGISDRLFDMTEGTIMEPLFAGSENPLEPQREAHQRARLERADTGFEQRQGLPGSA